jgi:hypothetical protein
MPYTHEGIVTHEPMPPESWPTGHVRVELTAPEDDECVRVWVHGVTHLLHATTARELANMLEQGLREYEKAKKEFGEELLRRIKALREGG